MDVITYIPADRVRQLERPRHPAEALAHELAARWGVECAPLLERARTAARQASLPRAQRGANVRHLFVAAAPQGIPPRVLLVDDIYTSGSTASAAAGALRRAGASSVQVMTFARAVR